MHGFEPGLPSLSYLALRDAGALTVATFFSPERLSYPPARTRRERLLGRLDALLATSEETAEAAAERFPGRYELVPLGVDLSRARRRSGSSSCSSGARRSGRSCARSRASSPRSPTGSSRCCGRARWRRGRRCRARCAAAPACARRSTRRPAPTCLREAAVFVPAVEGIPRVELEARAAGVAVASPPGRDGPAGARRRRGGAADGGRRVPRAPRRGRARGRARAELLVSRGQRDGVYASHHSPPAPGRAPRAPLETRDWIVVDLHMHTTWSHDCSIDVDELIDHAEAEGLGAIAVTDHNVFGGALEAVERARGRKLIVIPGEEVKTDGAGRGDRPVPEGGDPARHVASPRRSRRSATQGGLVYIPHPFDRLHAIPDARRCTATSPRSTCSRCTTRASSSRATTTRRCASPGSTTSPPGAGSDAHVLQGVGTGAVRMRRFNGPEEFLLSLRSAEVLRRPKSLAYLQGLKWVAQAKERVR